MIVLIDNDTINRNDIDTINRLEVENDTAENNSYFIN